MTWTCRLARLSMVVSVLGTGVALAASTALAQTSTAALRGRVLGEQRSPIAEAQVEVQNTANGLRRGTVSNADGFYNIAAIPPGSYIVRVRRIGYSPIERPVRLQIGEVINLDLDLSPAAQQLSTVTVVSTPATADARTSEVATNVSTEQIENLPQGNRNFLEFA